jgi:hypothetical protein
MRNKRQRRSGRLCAGPCASRWLALLTCLPALALGGCGILSFDVSNDIPPQTIAGSPVGALLPPSLFSIPTNVNISTETASRGTGPAKSATLSSLTLTVTMPSDGTFDFLTSISITVSSAGGGLPEKEIARLEPVPGTKTISIPPIGGVDLLPYINAGATISAAASGHMPSRDVTFNGKVVVTIHV